jgi:hypothetical protein
MKGRLLTTSLVILIAVLILASPVLAAKPPTVKVGDWSPTKIAVGDANVVFEAKDITWSGFTASKIELWLDKCSPAYCVLYDLPVASHDIATGETGPFTLTWTDTGSISSCKGWYTRMTVVVIGGSTNLVTYGPKYVGKCAR